MRNKIRLLVTLANHDLPPRTDTPGIGRLIHSQLQEMDYTQFDITAVCIETNQGDIIDTPKYNFIRLKFNSTHLKLLQTAGRHIRRLFFGITDAKKIYRNILIFFYTLKHIRDFDIIVVHNYPLTAIWLVPIARLLNPKLKIIYYYHSSNLEWFISQYPKIKSVDGIITIAGDTLNDVPTSSIINNHKRQTLNLLQPPKSKTLRLISSSNIDANKGILHITEAVQKIAHQGYPIQLDIYGKSKDEHYFNSVLKAIEGIPCITYKGQVSNSDLHKYLPTYDAILLLSQQVEGNSMSLIEAIVEARLPAIASIVGGNPLVLNHGKFGALIQQYSNSNELADVLLDFIQKPELLMNYRKNIETEADEYFSPKQSAVKFSNFITHILRLP